MVEEVELRGRVREIIAAQPTAERTYLLEVLHGVQDEFGHVPLAAAEEIHRVMGVPVAEIHTLASFYDLLSVEPEGQQVLHICQDVACHVRGAKELAAAAGRFIGPEGQVTPDGRLSWHRCSCLGLCDKAPAALVGHDERAPLTPADVRTLAAAGGEGGDGHD
ncbi:MAG: NADH-quinone oxidoreductase subunit NuoE family protein [Symbiobacteriia bacterium]